MNEPYHIPALLHETIEGLQIREDGIYADVTFGGGGHSRAILAKLGEKGRLLSFDQDMDAYQNRIEDEKWQFVHSNFRYLKHFVRYYKDCVTPAFIPSHKDDGREKAADEDDIAVMDGILADLGVSFHHFDAAERGFSFRFEGPLDMRMNRTATKTAADIINGYSEEDIANIFYLYGELRNSRQIAKVIVRQREKSPIGTTEQLAELLSPLCGRDREKKDLARVFQALRMEVNDEISALSEMLCAAKEVLKPGGRMAVLTYHSLEDRLVKNFFRSGNLQGVIEKDFYGNTVSPFRLVNNKVITASAEEVERNPRARSAKLRIAEKI
ncbi:MAG: 16S rRNA (cytosine(1402)-N(4))-methyltransferase RsmH [Bacteroidales bacterium]|nr:16S rRNA (cytosine(1402)-N(4))-methyltransferase RsmH [Bacteroidales bacterium]